MEISTHTQNDFEGYIEWLDQINQSFYHNLNAELDAMASHFEQSGE